MPHDYTYRRPHKRSEALGYYVPNYVKEMLRVASFIDTSGSISQFAISEFRSENIGIARAFESVQIHIGYIDVKVHDVLEVTNGNIDKIINFVPKGGGGTDMRNIFTWLDRNLPDIELVVVFTDGYTPWPKPEQLSGRKVLWLVNTKEKVPSGIGEVIRYDSEESG
jgi:predicted metal-dependent peptidase